MKLRPMRFKDYVWPHNPRVYEMSFKRDIVCQRVPFGEYELQNTGRRNRVMRGEGEFAGAGAYGEFKKLASVFYDSEPGTLVHPLWDTTTAYFAALEVLQEPTEDYVKYAFEFWECCGSYREGLRATGETAPGYVPEVETEYQVPEGGNIWSAARDLGMDVDELMSQNKNIKNPAMLPGGFRVKAHE